MQANQWTIKAVVLVGFFCSIAVTIGQVDENPKSSRQDQQKRLASLEPRMSSDQVLKILGKPDEIRHIPESQVLDGTRYSCGAEAESEQETERWVYGVLGKGMFAAVGYVSMDRHGKLCHAVSPDDFSNPRWKLPELVPAESDAAVDAPSKMSSHIGSIQYNPARGNSCESLKTTITFNNPARSERKTELGNLSTKFLITEVYDSTGEMLYRDDRIRSHAPSFVFLNADMLGIASPKSFVPPQEASEDFHISPAHGFGPLPAGKYSVRVYFPFEQAKYYPSNLVSFELTEDQPKNLDND